MLDRDGYRPNVGIVLCNARNEVFWGKRIKEHSWQFPQGGIKHGETPEQAMFPEHGLLRGFTVLDSALRKLPRMLLDAFAPEYFVPCVTENNADVRAIAVTVEHDTFTLS